MTWCFALGPYLWLPMSAKVGSLGEPHGSYRRGRHFTSHPGPGTHMAEYAHHPAWMNSDHHGRGSMRTWLRNLLKSNRFLPRGLLSRVTFSAATPFPKQQVGAGKCRQRGSPHQVEPSTHSLFYQSLLCGKGCEIWRESEEGSP